MTAAQPYSADEHSIVADQLERFLDPPLLRLLRYAAELAAHQLAALYIVGGTVRDLLLGRPQGDLDLMVEGDAIQLAETLAETLGGHVLSHAQFGTATITLAGGESPVVGREADQGSAPEFASFTPDRPLTLDLVMARSERYPHPAALPQVAPAPLRDDLFRRDFTINTLAICLNPQRYGWLYDLFGGQQDLQHGWLRVLHDRSFVDDPTRILRGVRLAARLGFIFEPHTAALLAAALKDELIERTTPQRIAQELRLLLHEQQPERAIDLLADLDVLRHIHPALRWSAAQAHSFAAARRAGFPDVELADLYLGIVVYPLTEAERMALLDRYRPATPTVRLLRDIGHIQALMPQLQIAGLPASRIDQLLNGLDPAALRVAQLVEPPASTAIALYLDELRDITLEVNGHFLRACGLKPGPIFRTILAELRTARLDDHIQTRVAQEEWVRRRLAAIAKTHLAPGSGAAQGPQS